MSRFTNPIPQFSKANGDLLAGGTLTFYASGTDVLLPIFGDVNETISIQNPVTLGSRGEVPSIFFSASARCVLADFDGVQIFDVDPVSSDGTVGAFETWESNVVYSDNDLVYGSDGKPYVSLQGNNQSNDPTQDPENNAFWSQLNQLRTWNANEIYLVGDLVVESGFIYKSQSTSNINNRPSTDNGTNWASLTAAAELSFDNTVSGLAAATVQAAIDEINAIVSGASQPLLYKGSLDISTGDPALPGAPTGGDIYTITTGGTITVSRNSGAATSQLVNAGESIVYNGDAERWDVVPSTGIASTISYANSISQLASQNVQDAIDELSALIAENTAAILAVEATAGSTAGGIIYRGQLNVSAGDAALPTEPLPGDLYQISTGGTITVSLNNGIPVPIIVNIRDQIIWNGLLNRWDLNQAPPQTIVESIDQTITLSQPLELVLLTGTARFYPPNDITLLSIRLAVGTAPVGADVNVEIFKNGALLQALSIPDGLNVSNKFLPPSPLLVNSTDYLTVNVTQVGSTTPGADLTVIFEYQIV